MDTLRHFKENYPETDFYFIMGADSVKDLPTWYKPDELLQLVQIVGVNRPGFMVEQDKYPILWVDSPLVDLSSTEIRLRVYLDQSIRYQVPAVVEAYIQRQGLYAVSYTHL